MEYSLNNGLATSTWEPAELKMETKIRPINSHFIQISNRVLELGNWSILPSNPLWNDQASNFSPRLFSHPCLESSLKAVFTLLLWIPSEVSGYLELIFVVKSVSCIWLITTLWMQHARLPCPSLSPRVYSISCPLSQWCHPTISSSAAPFSSCPQSSGDLHLEATI